MSVHKEEIKLLTKYMIVEFILKGYNIKTIIKFVFNVFSKYTIHKEGIVYTEFPISIKYSDYENNEKQFYKEIIEKIDSLNIENRLDALSTYYYAEKRKYYFIYFTNSVVGNKNVSINNVIFYNPKKTKFIRGNKWSHKEDEDDEVQYKNEFNIDYMNAIVSENCLDTNQGALLAREDIDKAFDILKYITNPNAKLDIDERKRYTLDENYEIVGESIGFTKNINSYFDSLRFDKTFEFTDEKLKDLSIFISKNNLLENALHYYRKANESKLPEEKISNYWISLETVFNNVHSKNILPKNMERSKITLITEVVSRILIWQYIYKYGWDVFYYVDYLYQQKENGLNLSDELIRNTGLYKDSNSERHIVYLYKFLDKIDQFISSTTNEIILEKLSSIKDFYFNNKVAKEKIYTIFNHIRSEITLLYRIRNKIFHGAFYQGNFFEYYINKLEFITSSIFNRIIMNKGETNLDNILIKYYIEYDKIKNQLETNDKYILYEHIKSETLQQAEEDGILIN